MNSRHAIARGAVTATLLAGTGLIGYTAQQGGINVAAVRRVERFTRPAAQRLPSDGGGYPGCPDTVDLCRKFAAFRSYFRNNYGIPMRDEELLVLRTAWLSRGQIIWGAHNTMGRNAGLTDEEISRIMEGPEAKGWSAFDAVLLRTADELHMSRFISEPTWKALAQRYSESQRAEVILVVANYTMLAMYHNSVGMQLQPGMRVLPE